MSERISKLANGGALGRADAERILEEGERVFPLADIGRVLTGDSKEGR